MGMNEVELIACSCVGFIKGVEMYFTHPFCIYVLFFVSFATLFHLEPPLYVNKDPIQGGLIILEHRIPKYDCKQRHQGSIVFQKNRKQRQS